VLLLVRHAMPLVSPDLAPGAWPLTSEGRVLGEQLMRVLPDGAYLVSSDERKAWEASASVAPAAARDPRFNEVARSGEPWGDGHRRLRRLYVQGAEHAGWETQSAVARRFDSGVRDHTRRAEGHPVVLVTHGMALTVWLVSQGIITPEDAARFWSELEFPDCYALESECHHDRRVARLQGRRPQARTNGSARLQKVSVATGSYSAGSVGSVNRWPEPG
jgi:broad specificity phosphatase PhoE